MALLRGKYSEVPEDAIVLKRHEALQYQAKILKNWPNSWDTFAFKYGAISLSVAGALTGIYVNNHYRTKLKLFNKGKLSTFIPLCILPSLLTYATHMEIVIPDLILNDTCPTCIEIRSSALQAALGCVFPTILAPISSLSLAHKYSTFDIPYIHQEPKKLFQLYMKLSKPIKNVLFAIFLGHALLGSVVAYAEAKSIQKVNQELQRLEYELNE